MPGRRLDVDLQSIRSRRQQELAAARGLQEASLFWAQVECTLKLACLARPLGAKEANRGIGRHHRSSLAGQQVTRVLSGEHQRSLVLANAPGKADDESTNRCILEQETQLVYDKHASALLALDSRPQRFGEQEVDRRDHLVSKLAHTEGDHR